MTTPATIEKLVQRFEAHKESYTSGAYRETQVRREFVDPFFKCMGWDIDNERGYAEAYKDVVHEDAIDVEGGPRAPDYCFRIGGVRKFFVEAKNPSVSIRDDIHPAYQLRRYGWSAKLPLSILTDFEEFAVYDCRVRPRPTDKASAARILYLRFQEYPERWDEIASWFSPEAIQTGSFDKYVDSKAAKRGTAEVDEEFLKEIESWRELLAHNMALRNPDLTRRDLNFAVQRTIDRIIFLRMCEDRGIEPYGRLRGVTEGKNTYSKLVYNFRQADDRYNSGLFHFSSDRTRTSDSIDRVTPRLLVDDSPLKKIVRKLYYPASPYEFSVLPPEVLGNVYEQFLGKIIRLTASHRAVIEDKPEVKRSGGVYYTPRHVVDYIVEQTVGRELEHKTAGPRGSARKLRVLDPACGSGSFLLGVYDYLLKWHHAQYTASDPEKHARGRSPRLRAFGSGKWRLTTQERRRILLDNIYGVDIDAQAVEVTKLALLLKVLEDESEETLSAQLSFLQERALPDLGRNIRCGNSLVGTDFYTGENADLLLADPEDSLGLNAFDWSTEFPEIVMSGGFDVVVGNPPYDVIEKDRGSASWPHDKLRDYLCRTEHYVPAMGGKLNLFRLFIVKALQLLRRDGRFGMIVPLALLADKSTGPTRRHIVLSLSELSADCFPQKDNPKLRVFAGAKLSTVIVTGTAKPPKTRSQAQIDVRVYPANKLTDPHTRTTVRWTDAEVLDPQTVPIPLVDAPDWELCTSIYESPAVVRAGDVPDLLVRRGEINQTVYREYIVGDSSRVRLLKGAEVGRYHLRSKMSQGHREWFDEESFLKKNKPRPIVDQRRLATQRITGIDETSRIVATVVEPKCYFADSTNSVALTQESAYDLEYILALLNSSLLQWRFRLTSTNNNVGTNELQSLPIRSINFESEQDVAIHSRISELAGALLATHEVLMATRDPASKRSLLRKVHSLESELDSAVFAAYGLSESEAKFVLDRLTQTVAQGARTT